MAGFLGVFEVDGNERTATAGRFPGSCIYQLKMGSYKMAISIGTLVVDPEGIKLGHKKPEGKWLSFGGAPLRRPDFLR